jgi:5-methylcytosine-specific restriction endonuclease McrA
MADPFNRVRRLLNAPDQLQLDLVFAEPVNHQESGPQFYTSPRWRRLRYATLRRFDGKCITCGRSAKDGCIIEVDHIKPRSLFPQMAFDPENLQVLCRECNGGKSNIDFTDWRWR